MKSAFTSQADLSLSLLFASKDGNRGWLEEGDRAINGFSQSIVSLHQMTDLIEWLPDDFHRWNFGPPLVTVCCLAPEAIRSSSEWYPNGFANGQKASCEIFFTNRGFRMNRFFVILLFSRVYKKETLQWFLSVNWICLLEDYLSMA